MLKSQANIGFVLFCVIIKGVNLAFVEEELGKTSKTCAVLSTTKQAQISFVALFRYKRDFVVDWVEMSKLK